MRPGYATVVAVVDANSLVVGTEATDVEVAGGGTDEVDEVTAGITTADGLGHALGKHPLRPIVC